MTDKQPETNELCRWFDEEDGFKQGTAAPHKWVLQANSEIHRLQARVQELEAELRSGSYAAAVRTLTAMGYTWGGGEQWKPPIGQAPDFNLIDSLRATNTKLESELGASKSALSGLSKRKDDWKWRAMEAEGQLVTEAGRTAEQKLRANQMAEQHRMQAAMNAEARAELAEEKEATDNWRRLALQFDGHRMQALGYLKALLKGEKDLEVGARSFIASPPIPGEQVLAERIAAIAKAQYAVLMRQVSSARPQILPGWRMVRMETLIELAHYIDPQPVEVDGKTMVFQNPLAAQALTRISAIVRQMLATNSDAYLEELMRFKPCWCTTCRPMTLGDMRFVVCPDCGNKRCPRAHNHELACTGSNAVGQPGSSWEGVKPITQEKQ